MKLKVRTALVFTSTVLVMAASLLVPSGVQAQIAFSAQALNPTGDPIGGGSGYADVFGASDAEWVVGTKAELLAALASASAGDVIFVEDGVEIDMTGEANVAIPGGVTLAGGRGRSGSAGALLYSDSWFVQSDLTAVFVTGGPDARITGLRFRGPSADILDHDFDATGVANAVRAMHPGLEVDNSEFFAWDKWAIWLYVSDRAHIHHNYIHHNRRNGYGYGVWVGGAGSETGAYTLIEANRFDYNRHHIGSSAHDNTWEARYNIAMEHGLQQAFDRHTNNDGGGGRSTLIHHNWFKNADTRGFASPGYPSEAFRIYENWFAHSNVEQAISIKPDVVDAYIHDNSYGDIDASLLPTALATGSAVDGTAPLTVQFDASGSFNAIGGGIHRYEWIFGDGRAALEGRAEGAQVSHTFSEPGLYPVELKVFDASGIPGRTFVPVLVRPSGNVHILSAWLKDTYIGPRSGHYRKQLLIDDEVVWEEDVAGDEGWEHIVVDVSDQVSGKSDVELAARLLVDAPVDDPANQISEIYVYVDDVHVFGGQVENGMFEPGGGWSFRAEGSWSSGYESEEVRSGDLAFRLRSPYMRTRASGEWAKVFQTVPVEEIVPDVEPAETVAQEIHLEAGWNMVGLYVEPSDAGLEAVLAPILSSVITLEDDEGGVYDPGEGVNTIGEWDSSRAYLINVASATTLTVEGAPIEPASLTLSHGWNLIPYLASHSADVEEAIDSISDEIVLMKDNVGNVYYPEYGIDNIVRLEPGQGYKVYVREQTTLSFPGD